MKLSSCHTFRKKNKNKFFKWFKVLWDMGPTAICKFCFHSKVSFNVGYDLKATILWEMTMILSCDKLNWSQGIGGWLINLQPNPENILYKIFSLIETHVTPLSANTTKIVCLGAISFLLWSTPTCLWQLLWIKIQKGIIFFCLPFSVAFYFKCHLLASIGKYFYYCILCRYFYAMKGNTMFS